MQDFLPDLVKVLLSEGFPADKIHL